MFNPTYDITTEGNIISTQDDAQEAIKAAVTLAKITGKDVTIVAHLDAVTDRDVIFHPNGTNEKIWIIDKGQQMQPVVGQVYTNRGGGTFRCIAQAEDGPRYYNAASGNSTASGVFQNIKSGWTFTAKGIIQYTDGTIEWDHSVDGRFEEVTE